MSYIDSWRSDRSLTAEKHPDVGPSGNGWTYYEYDSRGNVTLKDVGSSTEFDLWYDYDRAGRLTEVLEVNQGGTAFVGPGSEVVRDGGGVDARDYSIRILAVLCYNPPSSEILEHGS